MKLLHQCLVLGAIASLATSCSQDSFWKGTSGEEGKLSLKLSTDFSVRASTRANDSESPVRPDGDHFKIRLESTDGSYVKEWETLNKFNGEESFPKGTYTVTASYGSLEEQGFTNPYYIGTSPVTVVAGETVEHSVTATLANAMVSVRYTPEFRNYFSDFYVSLSNSGSNSGNLIFGKDETRPCYVTPGENIVMFNLTNPEGLKATVAPATFTAEPRHHYIVTAGVKESSVKGGMALVVEFDETVLDGETTEIILSDELYTTPAPEIQASDFSFGETISIVEGIDLGKVPTFNVIAHGGIHSALFKVETSEGNTPFKLYAPDGSVLKSSNEIHLVTEDPDELQMMANAKLKSFGFNQKLTDSSGNLVENVMAVVDMKDMIEHLAPGDYKFSLTVTDGQTKVAESKLEENGPEGLSASISPLLLKVEPNTEPLIFMSEEVAVLVSTNHPEVIKMLKYKVQDTNNTTIPARDPKSVTEITSDDSEYPHKYRVVLKSGQIDEVDWTVEAFYPTRTTPEVAISPVTIPAFTVETDAYAKHVDIRIVPENPEYLQMLVEKVRLCKEGIDGNRDKITDSDVIRDSANGIITVGGLTPGNDVSNIGLSFGKSQIKSWIPVASFRTEEALDVPNGDFTQSNQKLIVRDLNVGGKYRVSVLGISEDYQITSSIDRSLPDGWATIDSLTCYEGSKNRNSWFMVPSTYEDGGKVLLQNVGYNHDGTTPSRSGGSFNTKYYCENAPDKGNLINAAGELFLGFYSYDGDEHRVDGINFTSRPDALVFDYQYEALSGSNDTGEIEVKVLDAGDNVIAVGGAILTDSGTMWRTEIRVPLTGYQFQSKAASLQVRFISSNKDVPPIYIPTGEELNEGVINIRDKTPMPANSYHAVATGSKLWIDNVKLVYK